jgi:hypothetical protein
MTEKFDPSEIIVIKELAIANALQIDALIQLLIDKGIITEDDFFTKLEEVKEEYRSRQMDQ